MSGDNGLLDAGILIVDDRDANVKLLEYLLQGAGYRCVSATHDPYAVCQLHSTHHYDLILLDLQMPGMDGFQVMNALKDMEHGSYAPVMAITVQADYKLRALAAGAQDFIVKPFEAAELLSRVHNMLEVRLKYRQLEKTVNTLQSFALYDALTGLANRRLLLDRLQQSRLASERTRSHCALMFLDIDRFKQLNDTLGHDVGDVLLRQVSQRLLPCVQEGDCVSRFGGDEFVVLLNALGHESAEAEAQARKVANKMLDALSQTYDLNDHAYDSTLSAGVVVFLGDQEPVSDLLRKADLAMYRAKSQGRNIMCLFDQQMLLELQAHETLAVDMRQGLLDEEFVLHCQIQLNAQGRAVGAEAQVLWHHARQGLMSADTFMGLAEESGMVLPLGRWALQAACQQLLAWAQDPQTAALTLAVNIGASQLAQADFADSVASVLAQTGAPAAQLILVLAEGALVNDVEAVILKMNTLRALGVGFCLDDFRVGVPSLAHLKRLPLVQLKIGRHMVQAVLIDESVAVIARAILALGFSLGVPGLAEGISTAAQRHFFVGLGCQVFQGDFFGAAAAPADMLAQYQHKWLGNANTNVNPQVQP